MSGGKAFTVTEEENEQMKFINQRYQEVMSKMQEILIRVNPTLDEFQNLKYFTKKLDKDLHLLETHAASKLGELCDHTATLQDKNFELSNSVLLLKSTMESVAAELGNLKAEIIACKNSTDQTSKVQPLYAKNEALCKLEDQFKNIDIFQKSQGLIIHEITEQVKKRIDVLEASLGSVRQEKDLLKETLSNHQRRSNGLEDAQNKDRRDLSNDIDSVKNKISVIEKSFVISQSPSKDIATKDDVAKLTSKLELASLDASNAVLRSNNSAQQITILEKKLEGISLLLKKHELTS